MNDTIRRIILLVLTVAGGSFLAFYDAPIIYVVIGTIGLGFLILVLLGMLDLHEISDGILDLKVSVQEKFSVLNRGSDSAHKASVADTKSASVPESSGKLNSLRVSLSEVSEKLKQGVGSIYDHFSSGRHDPDKQKEIDARLDKTVSGSVTEDSPITADDEFDDLDLDDLDLGLDLDDVQGGDGDVSLDELPVDSEAVADILANDGMVSDLDTDLEDSGFPVLPGEDPASAGVDGSVDLDELDNLSELSDIDLTEGDLSELDSIELDGLEGLDDFDDRSEDETEISEDSAETPAVLSPDEINGKGLSGLGDGANDNEIISFGMGNTDENDLFALLKSDTEKKVVVQEASLVRNLKDVHVETNDLVGELEDVLGTLQRRYPSKKVAGK